jgi:mannose-1-phosphate guanylyltransferase / phosphomannomutase
MRAVLMAGGAGTRLRPLTCDLPKPMVPLLNRPIAEHIINLLRRHQIYEIIVTLHYLPDLIRDYFRDGADFGVKISYAVEEDFPLGTAGCVKSIAPLLTETFLVISGDSVTDFDLTAAIAFHRQKQSQATLVLASVPQPGEFGLVITDSQQRITRFLEKPSDSEVFSDTVNTGIYILEPQVLEHLPGQTAADFSTDLFPKLVAAGIPMYGYVGQGYWCDVGNLEVYSQVQYDALDQRVQIEHSGSEVQPQVWVGCNTTIHPTVEMIPPVLVGDNCRIGPKVRLQSGTVIGDNATIHAHAQLDRAILWNGSIVGEEAELNGCIIGTATHLHQRVQVLEGAVVGSLSVVSEEAQINAGVKIWPNKFIEAGTQVYDNLVWGGRGQRHLFGQRGVAGLANIDLTPEFAVKLGVAYASTLTSGAQVMLSRDQRSVSRMVAQAMTAGLMSVGVHVLNLEATALPLTRFTVNQFSVVGGIHIRIDPERADHLLIEFLDHKGINISKAQEKRIATAFFKADLRRAGIAEIGVITMPGRILEAYSTGFERHLNIQALRYSRCKLVIDYTYAVSGVMLPELLNKFGCDVVVLNASLRQTPVSATERKELLNQLRQVVVALKADFGVQVAANGEQLTLVDETGEVIGGEKLTALMAKICLSSNPGGAVVVPMQVSGAVDLVAQTYDTHVIRTKDNPTALMEACQQHPHVVMGGSAKLGFIFPQLHPGFDAMFSIAKLIEMLTLNQQSLRQIQQNLPQVCYRHTAVRCAWAVKGLLMRHLVESHPPESLELVDGVRIIGNSSQSWVLILPDAGEPLMHIYANSPSSEWVNQQLRHYSREIELVVNLETRLTG